MKRVQLWSSMLWEETMICRWQCKKRQTTFIHPRETESIDYNK